MLQADDRQRVRLDSPPASAGRRAAQVVFRRRARDTSTPMHEDARLARLGLTTRHSACASGWARTAEDGTTVRTPFDHAEGTPWRDERPARSSSSAATRT